MTVKMPTNGLLELFKPLNQILAANSDADADDVRRVKTALEKTGHYETPDYGMPPYPDTGLFDAIKNFQRDTGDLKVDGIMKPGGPTEYTLFNSIPRRAATKGEIVKPISIMPRRADDDKPAAPQPPQNPLLALAASAAQDIFGQQNAASPLAPATPAPAQAASAKTNTVAANPLEKAPPAPSAKPPMDPETAKRHATEKAQNERIEKASNRYPVPAPKQQYYSREGKLKRADFVEKLDTYNIGDKRTRAIMTTYDMEGGEKGDPGSTANAGIVQLTVKELVREGHLPASYDKAPDNMTTDELIRTSMAYQDSVLKNIKNEKGEKVGGKVLNEMPDILAASALNDVLVRHGGTGGANIIRQALEKTGIKSAATGLLDQQTFDDYKNVTSQNSPDKIKFYDELLRARTKFAPKDDPNRFSHFDPNYQGK